MRVQANDAAGAVEEAEMLARAAGEKKELEGQLAGIRLEKQKLEEELEASKVALGAKSEECQRLEESLAAVEAERQEAAEKIGRLAAELDQQQKSVQGDQDRRDAELADLQRQILDLQTELAKSEGWEAEKARLAFSAQSIQEELDGERDVNRELQQAFQEQQAELERLKAISDTPLDKIQSECQSLVDDKAKAELRAEELQAAVNALTAQLDAYTFTSSSESLESVTKERDELRSDLEKLRQGKFFDFENAIEENRLSFKMARDVYEERIRKIERARDKMKERMGALVREKDALVREKGALVREKGALDKTKKMLDRAVGIIKTTPNFNIDADDEVKFLLEEFDAMPATASSAAATGTLMAAIQHAAWDELRAAQPKKNGVFGGLLSGLNGAKAAPKDDGNDDMDVDAEDMAKINPVAPAERSKALSKAAVASPDDDDGNDDMDVDAEDMALTNPVAPAARSKARSKAAVTSPDEDDGYSVMSEGAMEFVQAKLKARAAGQKAPVLPDLDDGIAWDEKFDEIEAVLKQEGASQSGEYSPEEINRAYAVVRAVRADAADSNERFESDRLNSEANDNVFDYEDFKQQESLAKEAKKIKAILEKTKPRTLHRGDSDADAAYVPNPQREGEPSEADAFSLDRVNAKRRTRAAALAKPDPENDEGPEWLENAAMEVGLPGGYKSKSKWKDVKKFFKTVKVPPEEAAFVLYAQLRGLVGQRGPLDAEDPNVVHDAQLAYALPQSLAVIHISDPTRRVKL